MAILTFDDQYTLADFGMANGKGNELSLIGSITSKTEQIPGRKGLLDFGNEIGSLIDKYPIVVLEQDTVNRSYCLRAFRDFITDEYGYPRTIKVHSSDEPDVFYFAKLSAAPIPERRNSSADFVLQITNIDGVKYAISESNEIVWGSKAINFKAHIPLGHVGSGANNKQITSNTSFVPSILGTAVFPYLILNGMGSNVIISCAEKNIYVGTFSGVVEIDCANYISYLNGVEQPMRMDRFQLLPNQPVIIKGNSMNFKLTNHYRDEL